jgi:CBS domain-containing protein
MRIQDAMTRDVHIANPAHSIREAARIMAEIDAGTLPVGENDRLVGMITTLRCARLLPAKVPTGPFGT